MTRRPIHRWKSWWLGVLVVGCLGWGWWDSTRFLTMVSCRKISATHEGGGVTLGYYSTNPTGPGWLDWGRYPVGLGPGIKSLTWEAPLLMRGGGQGTTVTNVGAGDHPLPSYLETMKSLMRVLPREDVALVIPYWMVFLAFIAPWAGFLVWRVRRQRNLTT